MTFRILLITSLLLTVSATATAQKLYKWVDENGKVYYSDQVPPDHKDQARQRFNDQGMVVDEVERALTDEEIEAAKAAEKMAEEVERARLRQEREDQKLLSIYASENDIIRRKEQQIDTMNRSIDAAKAFVTGQSKTLANLMARAAQAEDAGRPVSEALSTAIKTTQDQIEDQKQTIDKKEAEKIRVADEYDRELERFREIVARREARERELDDALSGG